MDGQNQTPLSRRGRTRYLAVIAGDFLTVMRFYSRLPAPVFRFEADPHALPDFARAAWAIPLVGALVGACGAAAGVFAYLVGLSSMLGATLTVATMVIVTGAFHEDGLADSCDGLWGGSTPERRLEIMKDSRIGSYGAAALALSFAIRIFALAELYRLVGPLAFTLVIGIAAVSRSMALLPILVLPPARADGLAAGVPLPSLRALLLAIAIGLAILAAATHPLDLESGLAGTVIAIIPILWTMSRIALVKIGGHTGDFLGACQQVCEMALLMGLSAAANWNGPV